MMTDEEFAKIGKGFLIAIGGALVVYFFAYLDFIDVNAITPLMVALASVIINAIRKYFTSIGKKGD